MIFLLSVSFMFESEAEEGVQAFLSQVSQI
jgi:hypothetical protein